jgi:hypothetical protein
MPPFLDTKNPLAWMMAVSFLLQYSQSISAEGLVQMIVASHLPIHEGDNVALQCVETPKGKGVNVLRWELNDSPVDLCGGARILPPGTYSKFIKNNAGMEDRGVYKCIAEIEGKVQRANQTISILPAGQQRSAILLFRIE